MISPVDHTRYQVYKKNQFNLLTSARRVKILFFETVMVLAPQIKSSMSQSVQTVNKMLQLLPCIYRSHPLKYLVYGIEGESVSCHTSQQILQVEWCASKL